MTEHNDIEQNRPDDKSGSTEREEILEVLAELDEMTGDGGSERVYPEEFNVSHLESYFKYDGVRITWEANEDEFVRVYQTHRKTSHNFNIGPYTVDAKRARRGGGLSVIHRDKHPDAYDQTAHLGNYFDDWDSSDEEGENR